MRTQPPIISHASVQCIHIAYERHPDDTEYQHENRGGRRVGDQKDGELRSVDLRALQ